MNDTRISWDVLGYGARVIAVPVAYAVAMALLEAVVVVYLRALYYPDGFTFPLVHIPARMALIEVAREAATIIMLLAVALLTGRSGWERFGWFCAMFGIWDGFYYLWLKLLLDWPASLMDWDILFLIPLPWVGPVIAPLIIACGMTVFGGWLALYSRGGGAFSPDAMAWSCGIAGTTALLYTFMRDTGAGFGAAMPEAYRYDLFAVGIVFCLAGVFFAIRPTWRRGMK